MTAKPPLQTHASRSFYETIVRLAATLFAVAAYLILLKYSLVNIFVLAFVLGGLFLYAYLINKKYRLEENKVKLITLDRSYLHIFVDIINETCRAALLSVIVFIIVNRKFSLLEDDYSLTREASTIAVIGLAYLGVLWFYHHISKLEQKALNND